LEKFKGVFVKIQGLDQFLEFLNYFSIANSVDWVHGPMDRIHELGLPVHATMLNISRRLGDQQLRLNQIEPVSFLSSRS
jgi:hypothetical protein